MSAGRIGAPVALAAMGAMVVLVPAGGLLAGQTVPAPAAAATPSAATLAKGRELFDTWGCGSCHSLADASSNGHVGPAFDGNPNVTKAFVINRVTNGQGAMPSFGGQMTDDEIATIATYVSSVAKKQE